MSNRHQRRAADKRARVAMGKALANSRPLKHLPVPPSALRTPRGRKWLRRLLNETSARMPTVGDWSGSMVLGEPVLTRDEKPDSRPTTTFWAGCMADSVAVFMRVVSRGLV